MRIKFRSKNEIKILHLIMVYNNWYILLVNCKNVERTNLCLYLALFTAVISVIFEMKLFLYKK
jgi:hypothetical protein